MNPTYTIKDILVEAGVNPRRFFKLTPYNKPATQFSNPINLKSIIDTFPESTGLATGSIDFDDKYYKQLIIIDCDEKDNRHGIDNLTAYFSKINNTQVPDTYSVLTKSAGIHFYFTAPSSVKIANSAGKVAEGVDVRGYHGYCVCPPTPRYLVCHQTKIAELPQAIIDNLIADNSKTYTSSLPPSLTETPVGHLKVSPILWKLGMGVKTAHEGKRNHTLYKAAFQLFAHCFKTGEEFPYTFITNCASQAGLPIDEINACLNSAEKGASTIKETIDDNEQKLA